MSKVPLKLYVEEEAIDVVESVRDNSTRTPEIWDMSKSEAGREIFKHGLEQLGEKPALEDLVDDIDLEVWQKQKQYDKKKKKGRLYEMQGGWRGRVRSRMNGRLAGAEPYSPEKMISLCDLYWDEIEIWEEDEEILDKHRRWLDQRIQEYKDAYHAKDMYPEESFADVDDKVAVGSDLLKLKPQIADVVETIGRKASIKELSSADAIRDSIATEFAVESDAIDVVLDYIVPEDVTVGQALRNGESIREIVPDEAITGQSAELDDLEPDNSDAEPIEASETAGVAELEDPTEYTREPLIEQAISALEDGNDREEARLELRYHGDNPSDVEIEAALEAADRRLDRSDTDAVLMTDGGRDIPAATIREKIHDVLNPNRVHSITVSRRETNEDGKDTVYCIVVQSNTWDDVEEDVDFDIPVLDIRTVAVDLQAETVKTFGNGIWLPQESEVSSSLTKALGRATTDLNGGTDRSAAPLLQSAVDGLEPEMLLDREIADQDEADRPDSQAVDKMRNHTGIDPNREWGYGAGPPPEVDTLVERLEEADLDPDDFMTRLVWGKKEPMTRKVVGLDNLLGNYGIEIQSRSSGLVGIDVDHPEYLPDDVEIPDTLEVSSPHGSDDQRHIYVKCADKDAIAEELGAWAVQSVEWGDLWIGDRYLVGPGSQLSEYGCTDGDHEQGERGGCEQCEDPEAGYYRIVNDAPIATVEPDDVLDLLEATEEYDLRDGPRDPDPPGETDEDLEEEGMARCGNCGAVKPEDQIKTTTLGGDAVKFCRGGCDD